MSFAAYTGSSMYPTLREPEMVELVPYGNRPVRVGDVVFFLPPGEVNPVVHRVVRATPEGLSTLGDNNTREDAFLLKPERIQGQVVAAWRGQKRRRIPGGWQGRLVCRRLRWRLGLFRGSSPLLHPLYQALCRRGWIARLLPAPFRPRVVVFQVRGRPHFRLLLGKRIIGRYDDHRNQWLIQRPFHLIVDGRALPGKQDKNRQRRKAWTAWQRVAPPPFQRKVLHCLRLADGCRWEISAGNEESAAIVSQLGCAMQLGPPPSDVESPSRPGHPFRLLVKVDAQMPETNYYVPLASDNNGVAICILRPCHDRVGPNVNLGKLSLVFARETQARGGVLIHGALAELDGDGVVLAAPGGTGKTTASYRLPAPWHSLSDDTTLVVRDAHGRYWAHPWPTWSRFMHGGSGGSWDTQKAVPLKGIFFLSRASEDRVERVGLGHAVHLLAEGVRQASQFMPHGLFNQELHAHHLERFNNLCSLVRVIPAHVLHISLTGAFWNEIERTLKDGAP